MAKKKLHPEFIKAGLREKYGTLLNFERAYELPRESARDVLRGKSVARTAAAMADALGVPVDVIVPIQKSRRHDTSLKRDAHRLNEAVK